MAYEKEKEVVASFMRRLYRQKLTTTLGGNISLRLSDGNILITPSATDKGEMTADEIGLLEINGNMLGNPFKPSIETGMHLEIHKRRLDVNAIVHAHPVTTSAFAATDLEIDAKLILEASVMLGEIAYPEFKPMGTPELAETVATAVENANCAVMRNRGALSVGTNMLEAFERLEVMENAAQMTMLTLGPLQGHANHVNEPDQ